MFWCLISSFLMGLTAVFIYLYFLRNGQFDDPEDVKYQMFREDEE
jgi:cbb3-type cytochrome oxidase maturation protein